MMKKLLSTVAAVGLLFYSTSCEEEPESRQQSVRIEFTISSEEGMATDPPPGSRVMMTVESHEGMFVTELEEAYFGHDGERFLLKPFALPAGTYRITDLVIVNDAFDILYAVPRNTSLLADAVPRPLSFEFQIHPDHNSADLSFHLLDVRRHNPGDFGYPAFQFMRRFLLLTVTANGSNRPIPAKAVLLNGNEAIREYNLRAAINHITLPSGITNEYRLIISSDGYSKAEYNPVDLLKAYPMRIVKVDLLPALSMLAFVWQGEPFEFDLGAVGGGSISIDWGDGIVDSHALLPEDANDRISHLYAGNGNYPVIIVGDLDHITFLSSAYGLSMMDAVDFRHLKNLQKVTMALTRSPRVMDLRANSMLQTVTLAGVDVEKLYLPRSHKISLLELGPMPMPADGVNQVIDNLYANVYSHNLTSGQLSLRASWEDEPALLGPPSSSSIIKLRSMRDDYGWLLIPDPFPDGE